MRPPEDQTELGDSPLPEIELRVRRRPIRTRRQTRPWFTASVFVVTIAVLAAGATASVAGYRRILDQRGGTVITRERPAFDAVIPDTPVAMLADLDESGQVAGILVMAGLPSDAGGTALVLMPGLQARLPGHGGFDRLATAYSDGGLDALRDAVGAFLGVTIDAAEVADPARMAELLEPFAPITVRFDRPVRDLDARCVVSTVVEAGTRALKATTAVAVLHARDREESDLDQMQRRMTIWDAVFDVAKVRPRAATSTTVAGAPATVTGLLAELAAGSASVLQPRVTIVANSAGVELYEAEAAQLRLLVAQVMPARVSSPATKVRVRLINRLGDQIMSLKATERLTWFESATVVLAGDENEPPPAATLIQYNDGSFLAEATGIRDAWFPGARVEAGGAKIDGVDLTITLGEDFRSLVQAELASTTTVPTTTTAAPTTSSKTGKSSTTTTSKEKGTTTTKKGATTTKKGATTSASTGNGATSTSPAPGLCAP